LAQKLKDCGVFGVSSDEYMNYALENRRGWESRGQALVAEMVEKVHKKHAASVTQADEPPKATLVEL